LAYPSELIKISNPDAPLLEHYCQVHIPNDGSNMCVLPIIHASVKIYDPSLGCSFFQLMKLQLLVVKFQDDGAKWLPQRKQNDDLDLRELSEMPEEFWEKVGKNTSYLIHPEETVADNFKFMVHNYGPPKIKSPGIIQNMRKLFE